MQSVILATCTLRWIDSLRFTLILHFVCEQSDAMPLNPVASAQELSPDLLLCLRISPGAVQLFCFVQIIGITQDFEFGIAVFL